MTAKKDDPRKLYLQHDFPERKDVLSPDPISYVDAIAANAAQLALIGLQRRGAVTDTEALRIIRDAVRSALEGDPERLLTDGYRRHELLNRQAEGRRKQNATTKADQIRKLAAKKRPPAEIARNVNCRLGYVNQVLKKSRSS